jgi:hypothetical protein
LCLKVSTVRDIEEDKAPADLASTFCAVISALTQNWCISPKRITADDGEAGAGPCSKSCADADFSWGNVVKNVMAG